MLFGGSVWPNQINENGRMVGWERTGITEESWLPGDVTNIRTASLVLIDGGKGREETGQARAGMEEWLWLDQDSLLDVFLLRLFFYVFGFSFLFPISSVFSPINHVHQ